MFVPTKRDPRVLSTENGWNAIASAFRFGFLSLFLLAADANIAGADNAERDPPESAQITQWIQDLGSPEFFVRERAKRRLLEAGMSAFDQLHEAQFDEDLEIALSAANLVRSIDIEWATAKDPRSLKQHLRNYSGLSESDRKTQIDQVARMEGLSATISLLRIVRFEPAEPLSKSAALHFLRRLAVASHEERVALKSAATRLASQNSRKPVEWIAFAFRNDLSPKEKTEGWNSFGLAEIELLRAKPRATQPEVVVNFLRWQVEEAIRNNARESITDLINRLSDFQQTRVLDVLDTCHWLSSLECWDGIVVLHERFQTVFKTSAELTYFLAESHRQLKSEEQAEGYAKAALDIPLELPERYRLTKDVLETRGLFDWAEREYRRIIESLPSERQAFFRVHLSEMLHDQERDHEAAEVREQFIVELERNPKAFRLNDEYGTIKARAHYFRALAYRKDGKENAALEELNSALGANPDDGDVLIALYQMSKTRTELRESTLKSIQEAVAGMSETIEGWAMKLEAVNLDEVIKKDIDEGLARAENEFAWVIANTEGDFDAALKASLDGNQRRPNFAGSIDTLAHCYAAKGDWKMAIETQKRALKLEPHSGQMKRALARFEKGLAESQKP